MSGLLEHIESPEDLRKLSQDSLPELCAELRKYMIDECSRNPGHLGSSLGAVELIVGIHYIFDTPSDKLIFDVGHQAYAHKILTGRREAFRTQRTKEGISGFPRTDESPYDAFSVGHSSTSISAALGMAEAARINGGKDRRFIALIGDGSLTGGLAFEGLNNAGDSKANLLIILNDNDHSIDDNKGGLHKHLLLITTSPKYNDFKLRIWNILGDNFFRRFIQRWIRSLKSWFVKKSGGDIFEALGIRYFGPIDGNDIDTVVNTLRKLRGLGGPMLLHTVTKKGKGYAPAEKDPTLWHAPGRFNPETGERIPGNHYADRYQDVFGEVLLELARKDSRVVGITPAMASGCGMNILQKEMPERVFDVGIEEQHAVTFSAGLAAEGMRPFCNIYSAFSQRAYDQIIHDVAMQRLPVTICLDRAGLVGEDGATHHGMFDLAAYRSIPDVIISSPADETELKNLMYTALETGRGPYIIRYPRGMGEGRDWRNSNPEILPVGKASELLKGDCVALVCTGPCVNRALEAAAGFEGRAGVYNFRFLKPLDTDMLDKIAREYRQIITVEDGCIKGGLYGAVCEHLAEEGFKVRISPVGVGDFFVPQGKQSEQRAEFGLDTVSLSSMIAEALKKV
ncbi:MAG: 1-deoxy-D-xylulose-5-phosphate synthase [Bacteroidales bacterium]|nr:1-deoxy-D-xylulose-5-phosphate synthase [Bacteroidales bacterium]